MHLTRGGSAADGDHNPLAIRILNMATNFVAVSLSNNLVHRDADSCALLTCAW